MAIPHSTTGSLEPAFATARLVGLTVKLPYTHALYSPITDRAEGTFVILVTFWEDSAPEKLTCYHCPTTS